MNSNEITKNKNKMKHKNLFQYYCHSKYAAILIFFTIIQIGCRKDSVIPKESKTYLPSAQRVLVSDGENFEPTILGRILENPFSVENMKKAYKNLTQITH
jgi:hypothetical protein